jgi:hypothetical protein
LNKRHSDGLEVKIKIMEERDRFKPWRRGVVAVVSATGTEGRRFESRQGVCKVFRALYVAMLFFVTICVHLSEIKVTRHFLKEENKMNFRPASEEQQSRMSRRCLPQANDQ